MTGTFVYVSQSGSGSIAVLRLDVDSGALERVEEVPAGGTVMPMAVGPDRRFLYAALRDEGDFRLAAFAIDGSSGRLRPLGVVPAPDSCTYVATDRTGRWLLSAYNPHAGRPTGLLALHAIGPDGWVQDVGTVIRTPPKLHAVLPDPSNRFVLATACNGDAILRYAFDAATGGLEPLLPVITPVGAGPRHLRFHPNGRFLYVVNEYDASVAAYAYDACTGDLTELQIVEAAPAGYEPVPRKNGIPSVGGADLHLTPDGRTLWVSIRGPLTLAVFAVDPATGQLTPGARHPLPREPRGFAIDPFGRWLIAAGDQANTLAVFRIGAAGDLEQTAEHAMGDGPNWVECVRLP